MDFTEAIAAAAEASPMSNGALGEIPGRLLLADGDGLAYYCAGNEEYSPGQARANLIDKLRSAKAASGAERVKILLTAQGSHKGFRYAVARVKPYQGQRSDDRRPKNWQYLRSIMDEGAIADWIDTEHTAIAEADDLFSRYAAGHPDCVIYTQDKDMRMVDGWHLDWLTHIMHHLEPGTWSDVWNEKLYGRSWFWSQMLHGDAADSIPGLPYYTDGSILKSGPNKGKVKEIRCGDKSPAVIEMLPKVVSDMGACLLLKGLYESCYGDKWLLNMLEQGILLWMRTDAMSSALNVVAKGNPLHPLTTHALYPAAKAEIMSRIAESMVHEETEDDGDSDSALCITGGTGGALLSLSDELLGVTGSAGSRPLDGPSESSAAPVVQCVAREDREQLQAVRGAKPSGIPSWIAGLLAKA